MSMVDVYDEKGNIMDLLEVKTRIFVVAQFRVLGLLSESGRRGIL